MLLPSPLTRLWTPCRGFIFASAQVRGGGDLGQYWYQAGKLLRKNNTFSDLIAVAQFLIQACNPTNSPHMVWQCRWQAFLPGGLHCPGGG